MLKTLDNENIRGGQDRLTAHRTGIRRSDLSGISSHESGLILVASIDWKSVSGCKRIGTSRLKKSFRER